MPVAMFYPGGGPVAMTAWPSARLGGGLGSPASLVGEGESSSSLG